MDRARMDRDRNPLATLRAVALALPEATERPSHGEPAWFVQGRRMFAMLSDHHHDDRLAVWVAAPPGAQEALVDEDPARFFRPPYVGHRGWVGVTLDLAAPVDEGMLAELITDAYRMVAPRRLIEALDAGA
jgi:hypothetical protein